MIDAFFIFSRGGLVLFTWAGGASASAMKQNALDMFVQDVIMSGSSSKSSGTGSGSALRVFHWEGSSSYAAKYMSDGRRGIVYVCFYQREYALRYVDKLIENVRTNFMKQCEKRASTSPQGFPSSDDTGIDLLFWRLAYDGQGCAWFQDRFSLLLKQAESLSIGVGSTNSSTNNVMDSSLFDKGNKEVHSIRKEDPNANATEDETDNDGQSENDSEMKMMREEEEFSPNKSKLEKLRRRGRGQQQHEDSQNTMKKEDVKRNGGGAMNGYDSSPKRKTKVRKKDTIERIRTNYTASLIL